MRFSSWLRATFHGTSLTSRAPKRARSRLDGARPFLERLEDRLAPSAGQLDPTFGAGGKVITDVGGPTSDTARAVATQGDGKVVVVGRSGNAINYQIAVLRYNSDGSLDTSFGSGGHVAFNFTTSLSTIDRPAGVAIDAAGHVIVAGDTSPSYTSLNSMAVVELNTDGSFNTGFGTGGETTVNFGPNSGISAAGVAVDAAGHIVLAGTVVTYNPSSSPSFAVARLNGDGSLDTTFGNGGETTISFGSAPGEQDTAAGVAVDPSGRVVVAGNTGSNSSPAFGVARLTSGGSLDTSFGSGGKTTVSFGSGYDSEAGVAVDTAGHVVLAGTYYPGYPQPASFAVARLNGDGTPDGTFGTGGETTVSFGGDYPDDEAAGVAVDASNRVVVAGTAQNTSQPGSSVLVTRLNSDGSPDGSFGAGGKAAVSSGNSAESSEDMTAAVALDPSGRVVVAGTTYANYYATGTDFIVTRLDSAGNRDTSWGGGGQVTTDFGGPSRDYATNLTLTQPDGKIVVIGDSVPGTDYGGLAVVRYNADGSLDSTFGQAGKATFGTYSRLLSVSPTAVTVDGSGRILIAGTAGYYGLFANFAVLRLNADGSPDTSFGQGGRATVQVGLTSNEIATLAGVAVDAAGNIVLAGTATVTGNFNGPSRFAVARLKSDGSPDTSFGTLQRTTTSFGTSISFGTDPSENDTAAGVVVDSSGRVVVAGTALNSSIDGFAVARLNTDGSLDTTFGTGGETTVSPAGAYLLSQGAGVALDPAGNIVVAGTSYLTGNPPYTFAVTRLNATGNVDQTFGSGGVATAGNFGPTYYYGALATRLAIDAAGRIAVVGNASKFAVALFKTNGCPDVDFGVGGKVTTDLSGYYGYDNATGAAFDSAGRLVVAGQTFTPYSSPTGYDFAVVRYLGHDLVVEAGSATFAADLQATVTALRTTPPPGTPRVVIHISDPTQMPAVISTIAGLSVNPSGPEIEILLDTDAGTYHLGRVSVPAGLRLILDGNGGACGTVTFASTSTAALTLVSGDVLIRDGAVFTGSGRVPAIRVRDGQLTMSSSTVTENSTTNQAALVIRGGQVDLGSVYGDPYALSGNTFNVNGTGPFIRLTGPNDVLAFDDNFVLNGTAVGGYQLEDAIAHSLDGLGGGTVFWVPNTVFVSDQSGSVQRGVDAITDGGTVSVQAGVKGGYSVGSKLLTIAFDSGQTIYQQADSLDPSKRELLVDDSYGSNNTIKFAAGDRSGEVQVKINGLPSGTFRPNSRIVANGGYGDTLQVDRGVSLPAWLYGGGNGQLLAGSGNDVLIGGYGDALTGGSGRSLMIGQGANQMTSRSGQDLIIAGTTDYAYDEVALAAIMAEWTSSDSLAARIANLTDDTANSLFSASRQNGDYFLLDSGPNQTVFNDYSADTVNAGSGIDWIFAGSTDILTALRPKDVVYIFGP